MNLYKTSLISLLAFLTLPLFGQKDTKTEFTDLVKLACTSVKSQGSTGTCWSFATTSFLESEIMRMGKGEVDLSEMFFVRNTYKNKAIEYFLYQGKNNFGQGGQAHDVIDVLRKSGMVPDTIYPGIKSEGRLNHAELDSEMEAKAKKLNKWSKNFSAVQTEDFDPILNKYIGKLSDEFDFNGKQFTSLTFKDTYGIHADDYVEISSYSHHPYYSRFVLEIPDNWSHALYYNLPIAELVEVIEYSLNNGYTVCWDGDTSERTFNHKKAVADVPDNEIGKVTEELRLETFYNRKTTDDHLMHIIGIAKDKEGRTFFNTKNSWGAQSNDNGGFLYLSEDYVRLKTLAILVHRDAVPASIAQKLGL